MKTVRMITGLLAFLLLSGCAAPAGESDEPYTMELRAYPQISNCGIIATKGGGKNGEKELQVMDNIRCVLGGRKG